MSTTATIEAALRWARQYVESVDARVLMRHVLGKSAAWLVAYGDTELDGQQWSSFCTLIERRAIGEPVAYLTGEREFYGYTLRVSPAVLIPRPETELLVELALAHCSAQPALRVLDLGTGSGALAVTLARELDGCEVTAVDCSREALLVAMANAARLGASVSFIVSNWFDALAGGEKFHLIVANPPYIMAEDHHLEEGDVRFEPRGALIGGIDGLDDLALITAEAPRFLVPGGWLFMEHGHNQAAAVRGLLTDAGFAAIRSWPDLAGIPRVSGGQWRSTLDAGSLHS